MVWFRADGDTGAVAIYTGSNHAPFNNPEGNLSRVKFHSELLYPRIIETVSGSFNLPSLSSSNWRNTKYNLFNHGLNGFPLVFGKFNGVIANGSVPFVMTDYGFGTFLTLGADNNRVIIHEQSCSQEGVSLGSRSVNWTVYLTDILL